MLHFCVEFGSSKAVTEVLFLSPWSVRDALRCQLRGLLCMLYTPVHQSARGLKLPTSFTWSTTRLSVTSNFVVSLAYHHRV